MERTNFSRERSETNHRTLTSSIRGLKLKDSEALSIDIETVRDLIPEKIFERIESLVFGWECLEDSYNKIEEECDCCNSYEEITDEKYIVLIQFFKPFFQIQYRGPVLIVDDNPILMEALEEGGTYEYPTDSLGDLDSFTLHRKHSTFVEFYELARFEYEDRNNLGSHCHVTITEI